MSDGFVVLAEFTIKPDKFAAFLEAIAVNARSSVDDEPGCRRFDICTAEDGAPKVALYEIYDTPAAFEHHLSTPHYAAFRDLAEPMLADRLVRKFTLRENVKSK